VPFREAERPQLPRWTFRDFMQAVETGYWPGQRAISDQVAQCGSAVAEQKLVGILGALRPVDEPQPRGAELAHHLGAQSQPCVVAVSAPDKALDAIEACRESVLDVARSVRRFACTIGHRQHLTGRNAGLDQ